MGNYISKLTKKSLVLIMVLAMAFTLVPMAPENSEKAEAGESASTLYFGQNSTTSVEYFIYTNENKSNNWYKGYGTSWSVEWNAPAALPQLNLSGCSMGDYYLQIDTKCIINVSGSNYVKGIGLGTDGDIAFSGSGVLIDSNKTIYCGCGDNIYFAKVSGGDYALYYDKECKLKYGDEKGLTWNVMEYVTNSSLVKYAMLTIYGKLDRNIVFVNNINNKYVLALGVAGKDALVKSIDASGSDLTIQSTSEANLTISDGDIKADNIYICDCKDLTVVMNRGDIVGTSPASDSKLIIGGNNPTKLVMKDGKIKYESGTISMVNAEVSVLNLNENENAVSMHKLIIDNSTLKVDSKNKGIYLNAMATGSNAASVLSIYKGSLNVSAGNIGIQGKADIGGYYYNNVSVLDEDGFFIVQGGTKAVESVAFEPIPEGKIVKSADNRGVYFNIGTDANFTTDYFYTDSTTPAKALVLKDKPTTIDTNIYLPDPYVKADDGTLMKESEVYKYNEQLHQAEVARIQEEAKDWRVACRTKLGKKGIKVYAYLDGLATEELEQYLASGNYTVSYDWYRADGKGKKYKFVNTTEKNSYYNTSVKNGKTYYYKCKITIYDQDGQIVRTQLTDCTKGYRTFRKTA